jgi:hypothetical protein
MKKILFILMGTIVFSFSNKIGEKTEIKPDFATYVKISGSYFKDKNYIYYNGDRQYVDIHSFEVLEGPYSKDKNGIYVPRSIIKEKKTVIFYLSKLNNADIPTFITYESNREIEGVIYNAEDKNYYYYYGNIVKKK